MIDWRGLRYYCAPDWQTRVGVKVIEEAQEPVIPLETCRRHLELVPIDGDSDAESHPDDELILGFLAAAVDYAEDYTGLSITQRTLEMSLDSFPLGSPWHSAPIELRRPPLIEIVSFTGADGSEGELDEGTDYVIDSYQNPPQLRAATSWPSVIRSTNLLKIRYRAGHRREILAEDSDAQEAESDNLGPVLPKAIRAALLLLMAHFYENRSDTAEKAVSTIPNGVAALLGTKRIETGFA